MGCGGRVLRGIAWLLIVVGAAPIATWTLGGILASVAGCNYGGSVPCMFHGRDLSGLIEELGMTSLLARVTIIPLTLGVILLAVSIAARRGQRPATE